MIAVILVIGAVVGGAVGGTQARKNKSMSANTSSSAGSSTMTLSTNPTTSTVTSPASTTATVSTSTTSYPVPTSGVLALNCPAINGTQYTTQSGSSSYTFLLFCQTDFRSISQDIDSSIQYSFDSCINNCALRNSANKLPQCQGLTFDANLTSYKVANCFLKTGITASVPYTLDQVQAGALLLS